MNDEEFKKKLEKILEDFYQIDKEVRDYLERRNFYASKGYGEKNSQSKKLQYDE